MGSVAGEISKQLGWLICGVKKKKKKSKDGGRRVTYVLKQNFVSHRHDHKDYGDKHWHKHIYHNGLEEKKKP